MTWLGPPRGLFYAMYTDLLQLESELDEFLADFGFQAVDLQCGRSGRSRTYRLFIDRIGENPVTIDDCSTIARQVVLLLETKGLYDDNCRMEVSSAGLDRVLKRDRDFERFIGNQVKASYFSGHKRHTVTGELTSFNDDILVLTTDGTTNGASAVAASGSSELLPSQAISIARDSLAKVNLIPQLEF